VWNTSVSGSGISTNYRSKNPSSVFYNFDLFTIEAIPPHHALKKDGEKFL